MYKSVQAGGLGWYSNWDLKDREMCVTSRRLEKHVAGGRNTQNGQEAGHVWWGMSSLNVLYQDFPNLPDHFNPLLWIIQISSTLPSRFWFGKASLTSACLKIKIWKEVRVGDVIGNMCWGHLWWAIGSSFSTNGISTDWRQLVLGFPCTFCAMEGRGSPGGNPPDLSTCQHMSPTDLVLQTLWWSDV